MNYDALVDEAIELALRGRGDVEPNPRVGALALADGEIVGRGFHAAWGGAHAEPNALADARANGATPDTVVVTLEPCSSRGGAKQRPPCTDALIEAGVKRVVIGATDPDPRHRGAAAEVLRGAGIELVRGVREDACRAINRAFDRWLSLDRPWVIAKWAMTLDGKIAASTGDSKWISGETARRRVHGLRARVDAVLIGFRTAQRDDPKLTVRDADGEDPIRVVVDPNCETQPDWNLVTTARDVPTWVLVSDDAPTERREALERLGVSTIAVPRTSATRIDMPTALRLLRERGVRTVLAEGGGALLAQLFERHCVDQVEAFVASRIMLGGSRSPTPFDGGGFPSVREALRLDEVWHAESGDDLVVRGVFH